jgi:DNA-directed RNA polymerase
MYAGGYYTIPTELIKIGMYRHTAAVPHAISRGMLGALNTVQATPWRINRFIAETMDQVWRGGGRIAGLPDAQDVELPATVPTDVYERMSDAEKIAISRRRAIAHDINAHMRAKREGFMRKLGLAVELKDKPGIWFPHALDFRGRVYPLPQDLNPQGDDIAKALLEFRDGMPLKSIKSLEWLAIALANAAGQDKLSFVDRLRWVDANRELIRDSAHNPLDGERFWCQESFDSPWVFLALAREYVCCDLNHVPVNIDATCSGIQHLSAMGLDPVGGRATNLTDTGRREDLYSEVADAVATAVSLEALNGEPQAQAWLGRVTRTVVKRAVMTTPYGVTERGIRDQLIGDGHVHTVAEGGAMFDAAEYMTAKIIEALETTATSARGIMQYFQDCAVALTDHGRPLEWTTPVGMRIRQQYNALSQMKVQTLFGEVNVFEEDPNKGLQRRKQAQSSAPNGVHSFDAAHLAKTVLAAGREGIHHFSLIHDSYGTHAANVDTLGRVIREEFVSMYSQDRLAEFDTNLREANPGIDLPAPPARGTLNLQEVLKSPYFFS